ncbi:putative MFS family arabinose efflux permease [Paenibacillus sp. BK033]|uniref:staphylopine family metallophore export MFS transporter CntE n=1 Tax=Paenibacillus sp. BK033 TaxID=2512133 RepID=UPI0010DE999F|nr:MFS transporter [Paenibacillus sp. BK033]TCM99425.1 putative MFS family arabinose efflux permease [Paenibacillus sp. BK033]
MSESLRLSKMFPLFVLTVLFFSANSILTVLLPLQSEKSGMDHAEIGIMMGAYMFVCMLFRPFAGQLIGRFGPLLIMRLLLIAHAACMILYTFADSDAYTLLRAWQGAVTAFFSMSLQAGIVEGLAERDRGQGMTLYSLSSMIPSLFGPIAAMQIWATESSKLYVAVLIGLAAVPILIGFNAPLARGRGASTSKSIALSELFKSMTGIKRNRPLLVSMTVMLCVSCVFGATATFVPLFIVNEGSGHAGLYLMLQGIVVIGSRMILRKRIPSDGQWHSGFITATLLSSLIGSLLLSFTQQFSSVLYLSAVFNGFAMALLYPTLTTYLSFILPVHSKYAWMGLFMCSYDLGYSLGGLVMGLIVEGFSYVIMFQCCATLSLIAWVVIWSNRRRMHNDQLAVNI